MRNRMNALAPAFLVLSLAAGGGLSATPLAGVTTSFGGVTVRATPSTLSGGTWEFQIVFDTHSQDLRDDVAKSATLVAGGASHAALEWMGDPPGGHHRKGVLRFKPVSPTPQAIELRIQRAGETAPRSFRWELR